MADGFCGNPMPHDRHEEWEGHWCGGVHREEVSDIVYKEKYEPSEMAEDGTSYSKVTILIEDKNGDVTIIHAPKSAFIQLDVERQTYVPIDVVTRDFTPEIEKATFKFTPRAIGDEPAFTIERKTEENAHS